MYLCIAELFNSFLCCLRFSLVCPDGFEDAAVSAECDTLRCLRSALAASEDIVAAFAVNHVGSIEFTALARGEVSKAITPGAAWLISVVCSGRGRTAPMAGRLRFFRWRPGTCELTSRQQALASWVVKAEARCADIHTSTSSHRTGRNMLKEALNDPPLITLQKHPDQGQFSIQTQNAPFRNLRNFEE